MSAGTRDAPALPGDARFHEPGTRKEPASSPTRAVPAYPRAGVIGETVGGKYTIVRQLGQGGMGAVYEARHGATGKRVALKVITGELGADPRLVKRFEQEARAAGVIESDHIVQVFDAGRDEATGVPFLAMEYLVGEDVQQLLARLGPLPADLALRIGVQACLGLEKAHAQGIVHRDIKPANLFLMERDSGDRVVKVLDFGIAKMAGEGIGTEQKRKAITQAGTVIGSPLYMSPEQARGTVALDHRTDIWSLGIVLYQALTGHTPFDGVASVGDFISEVCNTPVAPITTVAPWIDRAVAQAVERALFIDPRDRYPTIAAMREALAALLPQGSAIQASMLVSAAAAAAASSIAMAPTAAVMPFTAGATLPEHPSPAAVTSLLASAPPADASSPPPVATPPDPGPVVPTGASAASAPLATRGPTGEKPGLGTAPWIAAAAALAALGGLGGAYAMGWLGDRHHGHTRATDASAPTESAAPVAPPHPLGALAGMWWSESGQSFNGVVVGDSVELRVHDPEQLPGQGYAAGEAVFILRPTKGDAGSFRVEARVRPAPPRGTTYDHPRSAASCVASWSEVNGKPLLAQSAIDRLVVQTARVDPPASVFVREGARVSGCTGLAEARVTEWELVLGRTAPRPGPIGAACLTSAQCQSHDCVAQRCVAAAKGAGAACTADAQCQSHQCKGSYCR